MATATDHQAWIRAVVLPAIAAVALLSLAVGVVMEVAASRSDSLEHQQETRLIQLAVDRAGETIAKDQEASTLWDDAVLRVRERPLDLAWLDNNLGIWFNTYYAHDETYLLDPADQPIYAMRAGRRTVPASFAAAAQPALPLAARLREGLRAGEAPAPNGGGQSLGVRDVVLLNGRPAIVSLKPIVSETGALPQVAGSEYLHVSVRYLDGSFLARLSRDYGIAAPEFRRQAIGDTALAVHRSDGRPIGYVEWVPFRPGHHVASKMIPALIAALLAVGVLIGLLLWRNWRARVEIDASRARAEHAALHDPLTGLANRLLFDDRLSHALTRRRQGGSLAVLLLDLDRFKHVNDTHGHQAGDALIAEFGGRLVGLLREGDTVARLGGDEFAVVLEDMATPAIHGLCDRILVAARQPFTAGGRQVHVGVSIGVAVADGTCRDTSELIRKADIALYRAKEEGRGQMCAFAASMDDDVKERARIETDLREALNVGYGLELCFQPTVAVADGALIGLEALLRWEHPELGQISPDKFVAVAEETGLIGPLGEWALRQACRVSVRYPDLFMAVNLSPLQFKRAGLLERIWRIVMEENANPARLQFEITEHVLLADDDGVQEVLARLRDAGFRIALDDFGTGYSSLSYLRKFAVDKVKIDQSFIRSLGSREDSAGIVTAMAALGQVLGLTVVAEGVETAEQRQFLTAIGCHEMQGYLISEGVSEADLPAVIAKLQHRAAAA